MLVHRLVVVRKEIKVHLVLVVMDILLAIIINMLLVAVAAAGMEDQAIINRLITLMFIEIIMVVALVMYILHQLLLIIHPAVYLIRLII